MESFVTVATQAIVLGLYELNERSRGDAELSQLFLQPIIAYPLSAPSLFDGTILLDDVLLSINLFEEGRQHDS